MATAKRVEDRYTSDGALISDLEDVLAIETGRAGAATGKATAVLNSLPESKRRRVPFAVRNRRGAIVLAIVAMMVVAAVGAWLLTRTKPATRGVRRRPRR